jgi:hypothetical protein
LHGEEGAGTWPVFDYDLAQLFESDGAIRRATWSARRQAENR